MIRNLYLLWCLFLTLTSAVCPLCFIIAGTAASGGVSTGNALIAIAASSLISAPFMLAFIDDFRTRNVTFNFPKKDQIINPGEEVELFMNTFGLSSRMHLRTAELYVLNSSFDKVARVAREREFKVITKVKYNHGIVPEAGFGYLKWTVPDLPKGRYYLKYVSGWSLWQHEGKFSAISESFIISPSTCDLKCVSLIPVGRSPYSFSTETAPRELQYLYPHFNGSKQALSDFVDGVIDAPEQTARGLARAIRSPKSVAQSIQHPIKTFQDGMDNWENQFEHNPFRASGQAVGAALEIAGTAALIINRQSQNCYNGKCFMRRNPVIVNIKGPSCPACTQTIAKGLRNAGFYNYRFTDIDNSSVHLILFNFDKAKLGDLQGLISDLGYEMTNI